jgi:hypothetical protein
MCSTHNHEDHDYAEHIRERLPRRLEELSGRCGLNQYGLTPEGDASPKATDPLSTTGIPRRFLRVKVEPAP